MADQASSRRGFVQAGVLLASSLVVYLVANAGWSLLSGGGIASLRGVPSVLLSSWLPWILLAGGLVLLLRGGDPERRRRWAVLVAVGAWIAGSAVLAFPSLPWSLLWGGFAGILFVVSVAVALPITTAITGPPSASRHPSIRRDVPRAVPIARTVALAGAILLTLSLPWQWFAVSFSMFGVGREATPEEGTRYLVTVVTDLLIAGIALVLAFVEGRTRAILGAVAVLGVLLLVAFVFQVPPGSFWFEPAVDPGPAPGEPGGGIPADCAYDANRPGCGG